MLLTTVAAVFMQAALAQDSWQSYSKTSEMEINYRYAECHDNANGIHKSIVLLQFVNLTGNHLSVSFDKKLWYDSGKCFGCDNSPEQHFGLRLSPNQTLTGSCDDKKTTSLFIFDKMLEVKSSKLVKFELANIQIIKVQ